MKKQLLLLMMMLPLAVYANDVTCIIIKQKSGPETTIELSTNPVITFEGTNMVVTNNYTRYEIPLEDIEEYSVKEATGINSIAIAPQYLNGRVVFREIPPGTSVCIYTLDGRLVDKIDADGSGKVDICIKSMPKGVYIIRVLNKSIKVINKEK